LGRFLIHLGLGGVFGVNTQIHRDSMQCWVRLRKQSRLHWDGNYSPLEGLTIPHFLFTHLAGESARNVRRGERGGGRAHWVLNKQSDPVLLCTVQFTIA